MRLPRRVPTVLDQRLRVAITALLASFEEAAGEFAYVRIGSMRPPRLDRKIAPADTDHALGVGEPEVVDLAVPDHAGEGVGVVSGDLGGLGQGQQLVALVSKRLLDLASRPLERAGLGLIAEGLSEFLGLGEDLSDCLVYGAALLAQTDTPPKESCSSGGVHCAWGIMRARAYSSQGADEAIALPKQGNRLAPDDDNFPNERCCSELRLGMLHALGWGDSIERGGQCRQSGTSR